MPRAMDETLFRWTGGQMPQSCGGVLWTMASLNGGGLFRGSSVSSAAPRRVVSIPLVPPPMFFGKRLEVRPEAFGHLVHTVSEIPKLVSVSIDVVRGIKVARR